MRILSKKLKAVAFGRIGEGLCRNLLRLKGYRIIGNNVRTPFGEIDIIARKGKTLCFIEVKSRPTLDEALYALRPHQQKRILNAAQTFLCRHACYGNFEIRFDLMAVSKTHLPVHLKNAWDES